MNNKRPFKQSRRRKRTTTYPAALTTYNFRFFFPTSPSDSSSPFRLSPANIAGLGDRVLDRVWTPRSAGGSSREGLGGLPRGRRAGCSPWVPIWSATTGSSVPETAFPEGPAEGLGGGVAGTARRPAALSSCELSGVAPIRWTGGTGGGMGWGSNVARMGGGVGGNAARG
jgi:hypothetical protein